MSDRLIMWLPNVDTQHTQPKEFFNRNMKKAQRKRRVLSSNFIWVFQMLVEIVVCVSFQYCTDLIKDITLNQERLYKTFLLIPNHLFSYSDNFTQQSSGEKKLWTFPMNIIISKSNAEIWKHILQIGISNYLLGFRCLLCLINLLSLLTPIKVRKDFNCKDQFR